MPRTLTKTVDKGLYLEDLGVGVLLEGVQVESHRSYK
jgi:hypothetical protein